MKGRDHRYAAYPREEGVHAACWVVGADSFVDAAIRFAETRDAEGELSIVVADCETGRERCFVINLHDGDVRAC